MIYDGFFSVGNIKQRVKPSKMYKNFLESFSDKPDKSNDEIFSKIGFGLSKRRYSAYRNLIALIILGWSVFKVIAGHPQSTVKILILLLIFMFLTTPKNIIIGKKKSPFKMTMDFLYKRRKSQLDNELINIIAQMRNLMLSNQTALSADYLLTRLVPYTNKSKPIFIQTHSFMQKGRKQDAAKYFGEAYDTWLGKEFAQILAKLDMLPAYEFLQQIEILQSSIDDIRETEEERKRESKKTIIFTFAAVQMILIIFDFIYIVLKDSIMAMAM